MNVLPRFYGELKRFFGKFVGFVVAHPFLFFAYLLVFLIGVVFYVFLELNYGTLQFDEGSRSAGGVFICRFLSGGLSDPAGYFASYRLSILGFWFYPFLYSLLAGLSFCFFGFSEFAARLPSLVFTVLLIHATLCVARELTGKHKVALASGFLVGISPLIVFVGAGAMVDVPVAALTAYSLLFWIRGLRSNARNDFLIAGVLGGLAGLMKPTGILVLVFIAAFVVLAFLFAKERFVFSRNIWLGLLVGFSVFSIWVFSAVLTSFFVGGWVGEEAIKGVAYWLGFGGSFAGYVPPWYSPQWYTVEGWSYYMYELIVMMGALPFVFVFVGVFSRFKKMRVQDVLFVLFILAIYVFHTLASNKNPRYILPVLPLLYVYVGVGLKYAYERIAGSGPWKFFRVKVVRRLAGLALVTLVLIGGFMGLFWAIDQQYTPGMTVGTVIPYREAVQVIVDDGDEGIVMPDSQDNLFNAPSLTFYLASIDSDGRYGCYPPLLNVEEILSLEWEGQKVRYVLVYNLESDISKFVLSNEEYFAFLGKAENDCGSIYIYKVRD